MLLRHADENKALVVVVVSSNSTLWETMIIALLSSFMRNNVYEINNNAT
jgi:hypothetical protein